MVLPIGKKLLTVVDRLKATKIAVLGDIILDQYTWGKVRRISPEAPIPVVNVTKVEYRNGGAGCAASNIAALGCEVDLFGYTGTDSEGDKIIAALTGMNISAKYVLRRDYYRTIVKNRILTNRQQIVRVDFETNETLHPDDFAYVTSAFASNINDYRAVLLSDYSKGFLSRELIRFVIDTCRRAGVPVIVDPGKDKQPADYKRATAIKPNRHEAENYSGIVINSNDAAVAAAQKLISQSDADFITLSLDKEGVLLCHKNGQYAFYSQPAHEVFDVTGAGDVFVSVLTASLADKNLPESSVMLANIAAGISVTHIGVVHLTKEEIRDGITDILRHNKILMPDMIVKSRSQYAKPLTLVMVSGVFDNLSAGQILFLNRVSQHNGDVLIAVKSDQAVKRITGRDPRMSQDLRLKLLSGFDFVTWLTIDDAESVSDLIKTVKPEKIAFDGVASLNDIRPDEQEAISSVNAELVGWEKE